MASQTSSSSLAVLSCAKKLFIDDVAAFGDAEDILTDEVIQSGDGGTINFTIDVRRQFIPGNYVMHIVGPDTTLDKSLQLNYNSAIICREDVDPKLIHELLIDSNCERNGEPPGLCKNFISRYDWMHFRNWGDEEPISRDDTATSYDDYSSMSYDDSTSDYDFDGSFDTNDKEFKKKFRKMLRGHFNRTLRELTFFINGGRMDDILKGNFTVERVNESIFVMMNATTPEQVIGFVINTDSDLHTFNGGDWNYACLLTDTNTKRDFAFVFGDLYMWRYNYSSCDETSFKNDVRKEKFTYNIERFQYKK